MDIASSVEARLNVSARGGMDGHRHQRVPVRFIGNHDQQALWRPTTMRSARHRMRQLGLTWTPTMRFGQGCRVHLRAEELPTGRAHCPTDHPRGRCVGWGPPRHRELVSRAVCVWLLAAGGEEPPAMTIKPYGPSMMPLACWCASVGARKARKKWCAA